MRNQLGGGRIVLGQLVLRVMETPLKGCLLAIKESTTLRDYKDMNN